MNRPSREKKTERGKASMRYLLLNILYHFDGSAIYMMMECCADCEWLNEGCHYQSPVPNEGRRTRQRDRHGDDEYDGYE